MKFIDDAIKESEERMEEKAPKKISSDIDNDLIKLFKQNKTNIFVVGAGGAGNNTISRLNEIGIEGATTITVNTDAQDLFYSQSSKKILLGKQTCGGLGAGGDPSVGEECAEETEDELRDELEGADMVFVTCGLGGGTGTGSAPIIAKLAKKAGALTVAVATMPFSAEGIRRRENAENGLEKLKSAADTVIIIPNDKLRKKFRKQISAAGYSQVNALGLVACESAYRNGRQWLDSLKEYLIENINFVRDYLEENIPSVKLIEPEGTYLIWLDFGELGLENEELEDLIINKSGLWLDSGAIFGEDGKGYQRINIACPRKTFEQALNQLKSGIDSLK